MQTQERYFLKKENKLKSSKAIQSLFASGKSFSNFPLKVYWLVIEESNFLKAGFGVSSRNFKKATDRNKIKRLIREAYRLQKNKLESAVNTNGKGMNIFFIYTGKDVPDFKTIFEKTDNSINRLLKFYNEHPEKNI